ncbi:MAG: DUF2190 domain-containing protein [Candidatus Kapaibacterium sp.]|jgi:hypothetical protein|nr:DUF2190 family protein [Candidatus Kapabacteria bacterium]
MAINNKSYNPVCIIGIIAAEDLPANRFVGFDGGLCSDGDKSLGVSEVRFDENENSAIIVLGIAAVETEEEITAGSMVTSGIDGKAKTVSEGDALNGYSLDNAPTGGFIRVKLV